MADNRAVPTPSGLLVGIRRGIRCPDNVPLRDNGVAPIGAGHGFHHVRAGEMFGMAVHKDQISTLVVAGHKTAGKAAGLAEVGGGLSDIDRLFTGKPVFQEHDRR